MKIAFITTMSTATWGGSEALWADTAKRALAAGHTVFVSVYDWPNSHEIVKELERGGATIHRRRTGKRWRRSAILNRLFNPFSALRQFSPDVVLVSQGGTYDIARGAEMKMLQRALVFRDKWPYILLCHCEQPVSERKRTRQRAREAFKSAQVVGMLASNLKERVQQDLNISLHNVRYFQNPLKVREFAIAPWTESQDIHMAFVGRLEPIKGVATLIAALGTDAWRQRQWRLRIYGEGIQENELVEQVRQLGLDNRISFLGFVDDIDSVWRENHILVLTSTQEGVPNSMLEAMLSGRPVLLTNVGGVRDWIVEGQSGFIASHSDTTHVADALERMWRQRTELREMGRTAYEQASAKRDNDPLGTLLGWLESSVRRE